MCNKNDKKIWSSFNMSVIEMGWKKMSPIMDYWLMVDYKQISKFWLQGGLNGKLLWQFKEWLLRRFPSCVPSTCDFTSSCALRAPLGRSWVLCFSPKWDEISAPTFHFHREQFWSPLFYILVFFFCKITFQHRVLGKKKKENHCYG